VIDYFLGRAAASVTVEILDPSGGVVRRVSSTDPPLLTEEERARELIPAYWIDLPKLPGTAAGMHRWIWDLHYTAPRAPQRGFPISAVPGATPMEPAGPTAVPGQYRVRLRIGKREWEQPLTVVADPRIKLGAADYSAQFELARRLSAGLDESTGARAGTAAGTQIEALNQALAELLETEPEAPAGGAAAGAPGAAAAATKRRGLESINGELASLYGQANGGDAAPTEAEVAAADAALGGWKTLESEWRMVESMVAATNAVLKSAKLPVLKPDLAPPHNPEQADEE
jgi:hypothetical protein